MLSAVQQVVLIWNIPYIIHIFNLHSTNRFCFQLDIVNITSMLSGHIKNFHRWWAQHTTLPVVFPPAPPYQRKPAKCPYCHCHIHSLTWTEQLDGWKIYSGDAEHLMGDVQVVDAWDFGLHPWLQHGDLCNCSSENQFSAVLFVTVGNPVVTVPLCCQILCHWCVFVCVLNLHLGCK